MILETYEVGQESLHIYTALRSSFEFSGRLIPWCWQGSLNHVWAPLLLCDDQASAVTVYNIKDRMWGLLDALSLMKQDELKVFLHVKNLGKFRRRRYQQPETFGID